VNGEWGMCRYLFIGCAAGALEAGLLLHAGQPLLVALMGYSTAGTIALLASALHFAQGQPD